MFEKNAERRLIVLYGSQTGTSQDLAELIWRESKVYGLSGPVMSMDDYAVKKLIDEKIVVFVCSTTGQGDAPDNMKIFWKFLLRKSLPTNSLSGLHFAILGLGDSSYTKFNFVAKRLCKRLLQLSAIPIIPMGLCDDQHDLGPAAVYMNWIKILWAKLEVMMNLKANEGFKKTYFKWNIQISNELCKLNLMDLQKPSGGDCFEMQVVDNVRTTAMDHFQDVRLISFKVPDDVTWQPGDVLLIKPSNSEKQIKQLFNLFKEYNLGIHENTKVQFEQIYEGPKRASEIGGVSGGANTANSQDDEYRYAGCEDPKIMITTSHNPSSKLKMFVKELRLLFPNAQRMNRGKYEMKQLIHACRANDVTDFIVVHEHRGVPDNLVICHLPHGPTAFFNMSGVIMRHDVPDLGTMSEQKPHLIFHNFKTKLGERTKSILKYLFPVPKEDSKRVITFANHDDYICLRHHTFQYIDRELQLNEVGPRFQLKLYQIKLGTLDELPAADTEYVLRPYMNTSAKRRFLSDDDGWIQEDDIVDI